MRNRLMKAAALSLSAALAMAMMTGCGSSKANSTETTHGDDTLFSYDGTDVKLKEAWIYGKNTAKQYESYYQSYFGDNFWSMSMGTDEDGNAMTFEDYVKEQTISQIKQIIVLDNKASDYDLSLSDDEKAECAEYAKAYAEDETGKSILEECGATEDDMEKIYEDNALASKVKDKMIADVDTDVPDDEARETTVYHVVFSTSTTDDEGTTTEMDDKEKAAVKKKAEKALKEIKAGTKTIEDIADEQEYTDTSETFAAGESSEGDEFEAACKEAKDGDMIDGVYETASGYSIAKLVAYTDEDATQENKETIISEREQTLFSDTYSDWVEDLEADWSYADDVDQEIWADFKLAEEATTEMGTETTATQTTAAATTEEK